MLSWRASSISPAQSVEGERAATNRLLFQVGSNLYYVTSAEVGVAEATDNVWIMKSRDLGKTWTRVYNGPKQCSFYFCAVLSGTVIYIFTNYSTPAVFRFDTATDSMLADGTPPPLGSINAYGLSASVFSDGTILFAIPEFDGISTFTLGIAVYNPASDSWGTPVSVIDLPNAWAIPVGQITDLRTDIAYVFSLSLQGSGNTVYCTPVAKPTTMGASVVVANFTTNDSTTNAEARSGPPSISGGKVIFPYTDNPFPGFSPNPFAVVRSNLGLSLSFSAPEVVYLAPDPPYLWTLEIDIWFGWTLLDVAGLLYAFYSVNATNNDDGTSITSIRYRTSTAPGIWSKEAVAWTGPSPSSSMSLYPLLLSDGSIGIVECFADPMEFFGQGSKYSSMRNVFLHGSAGLRIWFYGVKRRKKTPPAELCGCPEPSHVKKAV